MTSSLEQTRNRASQLLQSVWSKLTQRGTTTAPVSVDILYQCAQQLETLKKECATKASQLSQQSKELDASGEERYAQIRHLAEELDRLLDAADRESTDGINPHWTDERLERLETIQQAQERFTEEGLYLNEQATQKAAEANDYSRIVIELQVCLHEVKSLTPEDVQKVGSDLGEVLDAVVEVFQDRRSEIDQLLQEKQAD